ncbi:hypothetical protein BGZ58_000317 [Dissophora ornata]|nr:hypothetical protein BGZ58_000317 [Dissophora ornata]
MQPPLDRMQQQPQPAGHGQTQSQTQAQAQGQHSPAMNGTLGGPMEQELGFNGAHRPHSPFPPPFMHPEVMHMMQQAHLQQQHMFQQQQQQLHGQNFHAAHSPVSEAGPGQRLPVHGDPSQAEQDLGLSMGNGPVHPHFMAMNRMTPPPGFAHFPLHPMPGPPFQPQFQHPQQLQWQQQQQLHHQQQMFMHQQMLRQQQMHQFQAESQHPLQHDPNNHGFGDPAIGSPRGRGAVEGVQGQITHQQDQIKDIESQINHLLFKGDSTHTTKDPEAGGHAGTPDRPLSSQCFTVQEIEEAQIKDLQNQVRRVSLTDPVSPPRSRPTPSVAEHISAADSNEANEHGDIVADQRPSGQQLSNILDSQLQRPLADTTARYEQTEEKAPFSAKDIDFYSDKKYDPYRPSSHVFDLITRDAKTLCYELMPKPEEETRKLALLQRLSDIANEVFGEAEVLPFGSSGNGLALANADMDVCVFMNAKEDSEEVSPVEFVERIGDRLEKDSEFENILQLTRARVPIVKLNHVNGIACDIGYQNDLAIWNTRLLRAYCRVDDRVRDVVVIIKTWAKRRKINNPYKGSLSSYAYVLLVIHVLQRRGVLPNLQSIVAGNGKIPFWDCQGFNRYFFEDIANLPRYWQPTPEAMQQSVGELLYEFFRYFASEFRYATHVVSIRSGGLLTKEAKEWTKDYTQPQQQSQQSLQPQVPTESTDQIEGQPAIDAKPVVKNRFLFCIEDPFGFFYTT